jgi:hypothetical protein
MPTPDQRPDGPQKVFHDSFGADAGYYPMRRRMRSGCRCRIRPRAIANMTTGAKLHQSPRMVWHLYPNDKSNRLFTRSTAVRRSNSHAHCGLGRSIFAARS